MVTLGEADPAPAQEAARGGRTFSDFLAAVLRAEQDARHTRKRGVLARLAGFPAIKTLEADDLALACRHQLWRSRPSRWWKFAVRGGAPERPPTSLATARRRLAGEVVIGSLG